MAYVEGVDLSELLPREGPLAAQRAVELISQVADALDAGRAAGERPSTARASCRSCSLI
jgi:hypothetical protein